MSRGHHARVQRDPRCAGRRATQHGSLPCMATGTHHAPDGKRYCEGHAPSGSVRHRRGTDGPPEWEGKCFCCGESCRRDARWCRACHKEHGFFYLNWLWHETLAKLERASMPQAPLKLADDPYAKEESTS